MTTSKKKTREELIEIQGKLYTLYNEITRKRAKPNYPEMAKEALEKAAHNLEIVLRNFGCDREYELGQEAI